MYSSEQILERVRERPFRPVRFIVSEGMHFDVHHPDMVFVGRRDVTFGTPDKTTPSIYERVTRVALVHIVAMEDLPVAPNPSANGPTA